MTETHLEVETAPGGPYGYGTAVYSPDRTYRYTLSRTWNADRPVCNVVMLNPSTATAAVVDPTVTRMVRFARGWGYGRLVVTNCFALRSTDPRQLRQHPNPNGPGNDAHIVEAADAADLVIAAWGGHATLDRRDLDVTELLRGAAGVDLHTFGLTKTGQPRHPLYLPAASTLQPWTPPVWQPQGPA